MELAPFRETVMLRPSFALNAAATVEQRAARGATTAVSVTMATDAAHVANDAGYSISDLATEFNVTLRTLRFYESRGLVKPRRSGLTRIYSARDRSRIALILKGKQLGFTLVEIRALLANEESREAGAPGGLKLTMVQIEEQITLLTGQRADIDVALRELEIAKASVKN
jgi:DNA-binding transcriptional MerR regulator